MKEYKLSEEVVQGLVNYLSSKPYTDVYQVIPLLLNAEEIIKEEEKSNG